MRLVPIAVALLLPLGQTTYRSRVDIVSVTVSVADRGARPAATLTKDDFEVREDGVRQDISYFSAGDEDASLPLHIGMLFDTSESMERDIDFSRSAAIKFLRSFPKAEDFTVVEFSSDVHAARFSQSDFPRLVERIRSRRAKGETSLWDAVGVYLNSAFDQTGRKVLVVFTDGGDTTSSRTWPEALRVLKASDVTVYPIGFLANQQTSARLLQRSRLSEMARTTGGLAFFPEAMKEIDAMYGRITEDIRRQYTLGYVSTNPARDGSWRKLSVKLLPPGAAKLTIRTRDGYFAPAR